VSTRALRYYEERGLLTADRQSNGYRDYDDAAVARVQNIRTLLDAGLSAENIAALTACLDHDLATTPTCEEAVALYEHRLRVVREQLRVLADLETRLTEFLEIHRSTTTSVSARAQHNSASPGGGSSRGART
jgi:DNA-binding transcriptional MerR regulator